MPLFVLIVVGCIIINVFYTLIPPSTSHTDMIIYDPSGSEVLRIPSRDGREASKGLTTYICTGQGLIKSHPFKTGNDYVTVYGYSCTYAPGADAGL